MATKKMAREGLCIDMSGLEQTYNQNTTDVLISSNGKRYGTLYIDGANYDLNDNIHAHLEFICKIGTGSFSSAVEKRLHRATNTYIAMKQVRLMKDSIQEREILENKDLVICDFDCPNIIKFYGASLYNGFIYIYMELMDTTVHNLYTFYADTQKATLPEYVVLEIAYSTAQACDYLKTKKSIMHRDIKPTNILINRTGAIKLCDFGLAGKLKNSIAKSQDLGCWRYMAPERMMPEDHHYTVRADVWSLGITLLEVAMGRYPYSTANHEYGLLQMVKSNEYWPQFEAALAGTYSDDMIDFLKMCTEQKEADRPTFSELFVTTWFDQPRSLNEVHHFFAEMVKLMEDSKRLFNLQH